jgi:pilus assembly protein Flp/PilA
MTGSTRSPLLMLRRLASDDGGATAIEYALIAVGVAVAVSATVFAVGDNLVSNYFDKVLAAFNRSTP